jgi:prolyl-tRNA editing enzyme YbaK/EbsC (Cys-tRNA(Pro) deacylase)
MASATDRVRAALAVHGIVTEVQELAESTRTAEEAARACGVDVAQIVKSLVFVAAGEPILVLVSGGNRADEERLAALVGGSVRRADALTVRDATGFAIGGVPPIGHARSLRTFIDRDLLGYGRLIAAAGTPRTVVPLTPAELCRITAGQVADLKQAGRPP